MLVGVAKRLGKPAKMKGNKMELNGKSFVYRYIPSEDNREGHT